VRAPTLVIAGRNDRITAPAASRALAQALPDARYVEMRRAAHAPFLSHRGEFAALVDRFLRGADIQEGVAGSGNTAGEGKVWGAAGAGGVPVGKTVVGSAAVGGRAVSNPVKRGAVARPAAKPTQGRPAKKKRIKARARKKLKASSR
jgi:hypothetical protein